MDNIKIWVQTHYKTIPESYQIRLNGLIIASCDLTVSEHDIDIDFAPGANILEIELMSKSKENYDTDLEQDTYLLVDEIAVNRMMLRTILNDHGAVYPDWLHETGMRDWFIKQQGSFPEKFEKSKFVNMKGTYRLEFATPLREFFDSYYDMPDYYKKYYNQTLDDYKRLAENLRHES
jgi:hypothetical protein